MTKNKRLLNWVEEVRALCKPDQVIWCDGSEEERQRLIDESIATGMAIPLDASLHPGCYLFRSDPSDVARVEDRTFIASVSQDDAGPTNNWIDPKDLKNTMTALYDGCMKGRTMYVVPFCMGPIGSSMSRFGVEVTDSAYVVLNMRIMTRMGNIALDALGEFGDFVPCLHSVGAPLAPGETDDAWPCATMENKYIAHFPEERVIWSYGSGYGGNALLGKKCFALRIASAIARDEGWMAEHMVILKITNPEGRVKHICAAFPSACGKTNLAMLVPTLPGWKVETIGDDIAWLHFGDDGRLYAINPEAGFFGVAPGTSYRSNPNAMHTIKKDTIFTNVALTDNNSVWWEGIGKDTPEHLIDWRGNDWTAENNERAAHPNARFTAHAGNCPTIAPEWEDPNGVPIDAFLFGGRRPSTVPLVYQSRDWQHGVFLSSIMGSEVTAAIISNNIGKVRRDPFAMLPFIGYHVGDYMQHWLDMGERTDPDKLPKIFSVNWFRRDNHGRFMWPGFGDNIRVLEWIFNRTDGTVDARDTEIGYMPYPDDINISDLNLSKDTLNELLTVNRDNWINEANDIERHLNSYGTKVPRALHDELNTLKTRLRMQ